MDKSSYIFKMNSLYAMVGITKQGHYKRLKLREETHRKKEHLIEAATLIRTDHKKMGCRKMIDKIKPVGIGRDRAEKLLLENGFRVPRKLSFHRTTYAGDRFYDNLITGINVTRKNQVFVSDITYIPVGYKENYYLTLVLDVYLRKITGWSLSDTLRTEQTVYEAFKEAVKGIDNSELSTLIFHSDKGSQYGSDMMKAEFASTGVRPSMGGKAWENAHAESLNGILKNEYINFEHSNISIKQATGMVKRWIYLYNNDRPHGSLKNMEPTKFETYVDQLADQRKPIFKINY